MSIKAAYCINYVEREKHHGEKADGHTLHATLDLANAHIREITRGRGDRAEEVYVDPGTPFLVEVDEATYADVIKKGMVVGHNTQWYKRP